MNTKQTEAWNKAITAIREALAEQPAQGEQGAKDDADIYEFWARNKEAEQPAQQQEPVACAAPMACSGADKCVFSTSPPAQQQEPVAWLVYAKGSRRYFTLTFDVDKVPEICKGGAAVPLYTSPPASKPWVGLTKQEIDKIYRDLPHPVPHWQLSRAIEAKLREKNA